METFTHLLRKRGQFCGETGIVSLWPCHVWNGGETWKPSVMQGAGHTSESQGEVCLEVKFSSHR